MVAWNASVCVLRIFFDPFQLIRQRCQAVCCGESTGIPASCLSTWMHVTPSSTHRSHIRKYDFVVPVPFRVPTLVLTTLMS